MGELVCLLDGREVGVVRRTRGRLSFTYAQSWRRARGAYPLSLSMPLAAAEHGHAAIEPFLWGLLPDNEHVLRRWAASFQVSPQNVFALIGEVGEDCAGAVQFLPQATFEDLQSGAERATAWLTEADIAERLRLLRQDAAAGRAPSDIGQFSLAGAQPKTALLFDGQRWGVPSGRTPTTHILKPTTPDFDGHAENEHLCLSLARVLGLPTADSDVRRFEDVAAIVVTRYDRIAAGTAPIRRVHQEDMCQALRIHPARKYQNEGGPGPRQIVDLLAASVRGAHPDAAMQDVQTFLDALVFNWLIGGTDAHAKNYSILLAGDGLVRLAPLYDIASIYAYPQIDPLKAKLAMKIGGDYRLRDIGWADWIQVSRDIGAPAEGLVDRARDMVRRLPDALSDQIARARAGGLNHVVFDRLAAALPARARALDRV